MSPTLSCRPGLWPGTSSSLAWSSRSAGAGSSGVSVVTNSAELRQAWRSARGAQVMYGLPRDERVLVQDHIPGREFSVASITHDGRTTRQYITRKHTTSGLHRVELGHSLPSRLPPAAERALLEQTDRAIAAVGVRNGTTDESYAPSPCAGDQRHVLGRRTASGGSRAAVTVGRPGRLRPLVCSRPPSAARPATRRTVCARP
ncbi:ATP-grasp domain-containing protein [Streptomyces sp. NBC_00638]|uniref:ATP-grasp domain-containing protein n=1 Tax=Streptomyces sp. NBC_00638 TaxID=2975794 RepID=UPI00338F0D88